MHLVGCRRAPQPSRHAQPHGCRRWLPEPALHLSPARRPSASRPAGVSPASLQEVDNSQVVNRLFIFGLGYTGLALARYVLQQCRPEAAPPGGGGTGGPRWHVAATCRSASKLLDGAAGLDGVHLFDFDPGAKVLLSDEGRAALQRATHVVSTIAPQGLPLYDPVLATQLKLLKQLAPPAAADTATCAAAGGGSGGVPLRWIGYLSSTGVYGDWGGDWVDEDSDTRTATTRGLLRVEAERLWLDLWEQHGLPVHIFRLGGIYGPGRSLVDLTAVAAARQQQGGGTGPPETPPLQADGVGASASQQRRARQRFTSRSHVYDICQVVNASMSRPRPGAVYNVVDDEPAPRGEVMDYVLQLMAAAARGSDSGAAPAAPSEPEKSSQSRLDIKRAEATSSTQATAAAVGERADASTSAQAPAAGTTRRRSAAAPLEEKRVRNDRIKSELGVALRFATYREGCAALVAGDVSPFVPADIASRYRSAPRSSGNNYSSLKGE